MCTHMCESVHDKKPWCSSDRHADASLYCQISTDSPSGESQGGGEKLQRTGQRDAGQRRASGASDKTVEPIPPPPISPCNTPQDRQVIVHKAGSRMQKAFCGIPK